MIFVVCLLVVKGVVTFSAKGSTMKRKKQVERVWRILLERCVNVEERLVEHELCVCTLCACMSMVKGDVVFGADEAPVEKEQNPN